MGEPDSMHSVMQQTLRGTRVALGMSCASGVQHALSQQLMVSIYSLEAVNGHIDVCLIVSIYSL